MSPNAGGGVADPDLEVRDTDPRIRIRTKMSRIRNTDTNCTASRVNLHRLHCQPSWLQGELPWPLSEALARGGGGSTRLALKVKK